MHRVLHGHRAFALACVVFLGTTILASSASAETCPTPEGASPVVGDESSAARLGYLQSRLPRAARRANAWFATWTSIYSALAVGQAAVIPFVSEDAKLQRTLSINAAAAALGVTFSVLTPPRLIGLRNRFERTTSGSNDTCASLLYLEHELAMAARRERFGKSWILHGGNVLFNAGVGFVLGVAWNYWRYAFWTRSLGILVGEMMIWTKPTDATRILADYKNGSWTTGGGASSIAVSVAPWPLPGGGGLVLSLDL